MTPKILTPIKTKIDRIVLYNNPDKIYIEVTGTVTYKNSDSIEISMNKTISIDLSKEPQNKLAIINNLVGWLVTDFKNKEGLE